MTGLLDVGYTEKFEDLEMVVFRRNITVGIGCLCKPLGIQRFVHHTEQIDQLRVWMYQITLCK